MCTCSTPHSTEGKGGRFEGKEAGSVHCSIALWTPSQCVDVLPGSNNGGTSRFEAETLYRTNVENPCLCFVCVHVWVVRRVCINEKDKDAVLHSHSGRLGCPSWHCPLLVAFPARQTAVSPCGQGLLGHWRHRCLAYARHGLPPTRQ